ncbi:MAG: MFS transporter [Nitrospiraceae bacterium]
MPITLRAFQSGHWPSLAGAWLHFEISFMVWLLIGALGVAISADFGLTATEKGLLVAIPVLGGALLRVGVGVCSDWYGPKSTGLALLGAEFLTLLWGWLGATSYVELLAVGLCLGVAGASFAVAIPLASRAYPPAHQGFAMGVAASANSGTVVAAFFAPRLAQVVGWHAVFGLMTVPVLVTFLSYALMIPSGIGLVRQAARRDRWNASVDALRQPSMYSLCAAYAVTFGGFVGLSSFLPIFFHDQYGLDPVSAGTMTALCSLAGSLARPFGGYLADRMGGMRMLGVVFPAIAALIVGVGQLPELFPAAWLMGTAVAAMGFGNGVVFEVVSERFQDQIGMASGLIGAIGGLGGFLLPFSLGLLKDATGTYRSGLCLYATVAILVWMAVALIMKRSHRTAEELEASRRFSR